MTTEATLLELERSFWEAAGDRDAYARALATDALHVFPGVGVIDADAILQGAANAAPWESFTIEAPRVVQLGRDVAALIYTTEARRGSEPLYCAAITSIYRRERNRWLLAVHQQTPLMGR
jgi:hypothetical protein